MMRLGGANCRQVARRVEETQTFVQISLRACSMLIIIRWPIAGILGGGRRPMLD